MPRSGGGGAHQAVVAVSGRYFSLYLGLLPLVSLSSRPADEGEGVLLVAAGAAGGGGEGGHHQTLRDLRGL